MQGVGVDAAGEDLAAGRHHRVVGACQAGDRVEQDDDVTLVLHQALGLLDDHLGDLDVAGGWLIEGRGDDFAVDRALHVGHLFRALVDEQDDQVNLGVVGGDRVGDVLQQHGLAGARRRDDQGALPLADRAGDVDHAHRQVVVAGLQDQALIRVERREIVEQGLFAGHRRVLEVDHGDLEQGKVAFPFLGGADLSGDGVAGAQVETANLRRGDVDIIRPGEVVGIRGPQKAEAVREDLQDPLAEDGAVLLRGGVEDGKDQILLAHPGGALDAKLLGKSCQVGNLLLFQFLQIHCFSWGDLRWSRCRCGMAARSEAHRQRRNGAIADLLFSLGYGCRFG